MVAFKGTVCCLRQTKFDFCFFVQWVEEFIVHRVVQGTLVMYIEDMDIGAQSSTEVFSQDYKCI